MASRVRRRNNPSMKYLGTFSDAVHDIPYYAADSEYVTCADVTHKGPPYLTGSGLLIQRAQIKRGLSTSVNWTAGTGRSYSGSFTDSWISQNAWQTEEPPTAVSSFLNGNTLPEGDMEALGSSGWAKFNPGKPGASGAQALGELLHDGFPSLIGSQYLGFGRGVERLERDARRLKDLGSEYLNVQFGWIPFLNDCRNLYFTYRKLENRLAQLKRDNGRPVRRRGKVTHSESSSVYYESYNTYMYPTLTNEFYTGSPGHTKVTLDVSDSSWFSARFRYWIPDIGSSQWTRRATAALFGVNPTPSTLWELLPWSWMIDWFTNVGDVIQNMSTNAAENLVAEYAYVMRHYTSVYNVTQTMPVAGSPGSLSVESQVFREVKQRTTANPYGFGMTFSGLSGRQMLILSALGLSRS